MEAHWKLDANSLNFKIKADRFLRNMVRAIVGTMIEVGAKKRTLEEFRKIITSKNRSNAGTSAPAHGLYLINIEYPKSIYVQKEA
jgi:tRNA pseudouridine38-40 synthase